MANRVISVSVSVSSGTWHVAQKPSPFAHSARASHGPPPRRPPQVSRASRARTPRPRPVEADHAHGQRNRHGPHARHAKGLLAFSLNGLAQPGPELRQRCTPLAARNASRKALSNRASLLTAAAAATDPDDTAPSRRSGAANGLSLASQLHRRNDHNSTGDSECTSWKL